MKTKPSGALSVLHSEIKGLRALDARNQEQFAALGSKRVLSRPQMHLLTESLFFAAFRAYEQFMHNVFLLYCCGAQPGKRKIARSFLQPRSVQHAESLVKSAMPFLDWSSPDVVMERADTYLNEGYPLKTSVTSHLEILRELKKLRNHIAHMSTESLGEYKKILKAHYAIIPLRIPRPGEYLLLQSRRTKGAYYLSEYFDVIENIAKAIT